MKFLTVVLLSLSFLSGNLRAEEKRDNTAPNPAKVGFPHHWSVIAWDTAGQAAFWGNDAAPSAAKGKKAAPASSAPTPPRRLLDRQSEK